jgi:ferredoxin-NADP reductase
MLRHWEATQSSTPVRLLYSARSLRETIYRDELNALSAHEQLDIRFTLTREWPDGWPGYRGRIDRGVLEEVAWPPEAQPLNFVCGPSGFVETAASALVRSGHPPGQVKTERFGPTGG